MHPLGWIAVLFLVNCVIGQQKYEQYELDTPISSRLIQSPYVPGDFVALGLKKPGKAPGYSPISFKCINYARKIEEPYSSRYWPQKSPMLPYPWTEAKRAYWDWEGPITREMFDDAKQKGVPKCPGCQETVHYKIVGGHLWVSESALEGIGRTHLEEVMKVALYLFDLPDMEFLVFIGDACNPAGRPRLSHSVCRDFKQPGFTMPTVGMWANSLGPVQMGAYHSCLAERFPVEDRKPQAVWRGSTTNPGGISRDNYMEAPRIKLHLLTRNHSDVLDARIVNVVHIDDPWVRDELNDTASYMPMEEYNRYCAILHLDGNGWSGRFVNSLIHYPTALLRAATNRTAAVEHLFAPGDSLELFPPTLDGLVEKVQEVVADCAKGSWARRQAMVTQRQRIARSLMDHVGIVETMVYSLMTYRNFTTFEMDKSTEGFKQIDSGCCNFTNLPPRFAAAVSAGRPRRS